MTTPSNPQEPFSPFLPSTYTVPEEDDRRRTFLTDTFSQLSDVINDKVIGAYTEGIEVINGQKWAYDDTKKVRSGYQAMARVKNFPNNGTIVIPNPIPNINNQVVITQVYGSASKPMTSGTPGSGNYFTFNDQGDSRVTFTVDDMNITITTTTDLSAYTGFIIFNYVKDGI